jgi:hypothetical protein
MQTKITTTETDNVMETASETSEDSTDQFLSFNAVCIRLCKFNPFPLFNHSTLSSLSHSSHLVSLINFVCLKLCRVSVLVYAESDRFVHIVDTRSWDHQIIQCTTTSSFMFFKFLPRKIHILLLSYKLQIRLMNKLMVSASLLTAENYTLASYHYPFRR